MIDSNFGLYLAITASWTLLGILKPSEPPLEALRKLFFPLPVPPLVIALYQFEEEMQKENLSLERLLGLDLDPEMFVSEETPDNCIPFAHVLGSSTYFALLRTASAETDLSAAPVVMFTPHSRLMNWLSAQVIAENLKDFLALLLTVRHASELDGIEEQPESPTYLEAASQQFGSVIDDIDAVCQKLQDRFELTPIEVPSTYVADCRARYPDVELWNPHEGEGQG